MFVLVQINRRKYWVVEVSTSGRAGLSVYSRGKYGTPEESFPAFQGTPVTRPLPYADGMYVLAMLHAGEGIPEEFNVVRG